MKSNQKNLGIAIIIGQIAEWYDFTIYAFLIPVIALNFFPDHNSKINLLAALATFSVGFVMRPFGGILFGHIGDVFGRKKAIVSATLLMGVSTLLIGFLPTYQEFGIFSPMLLIFLRLLQGLSCGGEFIGSMIFVLEHKKNYFFSALPWTGAILGTLLSSLIIMCISALGLNEFQDWGWRIPFWIGAITLIIGLYTRMKISESPETEKLKEQKKIVGSPLLIIFKKHTREIIRIILINIYLAAASYLVIAYMPTYLSKFCKMSFHQAILLNTFLIFNLIIFIPLFSILGKNIRDPKKALAFSAIILIIFILPIYDLLLSKSTLLHFLSLSLTALIIAPAMALTPIIMIDYLSPEIRYTGLAISYNIAYSIFGGAIPLMATYLIHLTNNFFIPSYIIIIAGVITLLGLFLKSNKNYNTITF